MSEIRKLDRIELQKGIRSKNLTDFRHELTQVDKTKWDDTKT
jgi:hypothetical protein